MKLSGILLVLALLLVGCTGLQDRKLLGKWQGASILEDGMPLPVPPSEIGFEFFKNGYYHYRSTLNYKEAGTYILNGSLLLTLDTINEASTEKVVQIIGLSDDSLKIKMNNEGKDLLLTLAKVKK